MTPISAVPPISLLIASAGVSQLAMTLVLPANIVIMKEFDAEYGVAQLMLTTFLMSMGACQLALGYLSDRYGRRPVLTIGLGVFCLGSLVSAFASSIDVLLLGRVLQGCGAAAAVAIPRAIIRDVYSRAKGAKMMSYLLLAMGIVPMASPAIGGLLLEVQSWRMLFLLMAILAFALMICIVKFLPETASASGKQQTPPFIVSAKSLLANPAYIGYTMSFVFGTGMYHVFNAGAPYLMGEVLERKPSEFGFYFAMAAGMFLCGSLLSARLTERVGADRMIGVALVPVVVGVGLCWVLSGWAHPLALFVPISLLMFSNGITVPNAMTGALSVRPELAGTAAGLGGFLQFGTGALATMIVGFSQDGTIVPLLIALSLCGGLTIFGAGLGIRSRSRNAAGAR